METSPFQPHYILFSGRHHLLTRFHQAHKELEWPETHMLLVCRRPLL